MRSEGFPFIVWGSGGWTRVRFVCCVPARSRRGRRGCRHGVVAGASLIPCRGGLRLGRVACVACVALCHGDCCWAGRVGAAVPWGLLVSVSCGRRCTMGIAGGRVAWAALCHANCCWACPVGGAVPWGLLLGVSRVRRCAMGIAGGRVAWVAPCLGDC